MQDQPLDPDSAKTPASIDHLDLVTAELRRRIAGIGLAIAELREETGRLRASADGRYHAVAVLDREPCDRPTVPTVGPATDPVVLDHPRVASERDLSTSEVQRLASVVAEPLSPWCDGPANDPAPRPGAAADLGSIAVDRAVADGPALPSPAVIAAPVVEADLTAAMLTWVPEPVPAGSGAPLVVPVADVRVEHAVIPAEPPQPLWGDGENDDTAAFEAFFSAEIEPEPSQRWLLSD